MAQAMAGAKNMHLIPLSEALGVQIADLNLASEQMAGEAEAILSAFADHHVIVFRKQNLDNRQLAAFASIFGPLEEHFIQKADGSLMEPVHTITNFDTNGVPSKRPYVNTNYFWHSDKSYLATPSLMTMLYSVELPPDGGDTQFADMTRAYAALPEVTKQKIAKLKVVHSLEYMRKSLDNPPPTAEEKRKAPPVAQPLVRTHPVTGDKSLYLGMYSSHVVDMPEAEGRALLLELTKHATEPRFVYTHKWALGDLVAWDNRCLMHRAVANYEMDQHRRVLKRVCVRDTVPA